MQEEILHFVEAILRLPKDLPGVSVEAGCFKGASTSKFSLAAKIAARELVVFDSFEGIPPNQEATPRISSDRKQPLRRVITGAR